MMKLIRATALPLISAAALGAYAVAIIFAGPEVWGWLVDTMSTIVSTISPR